MSHKGQQKCDLKKIESKVVQHTILLELFYSSNHFAVQFSGRRVLGWAFARSVIMREMLRVGSVTNGPLRTLLNSKEAKRTVTLAR